MKNIKIKKGVVVEYNGKFWGEQYSDSYSTSYGYGKIEDAEIAKPKYCKKPTDMTFEPRDVLSPHTDYELLSKGQLVEIMVTTIFEIKNTKD